MRRPSTDYPARPSRSIVAGPGNLLAGRHHVGARMMAQIGAGRGAVTLRRYRASDPLSMAAGPSGAVQQGVEMSSKNDGRGSRPTFTDQEALLFHSQGRPGKLEVVATKPMATQRDLSLAYSPGVAVPVLAIAEDEDPRLRLHHQGQFRRRHHQRHRHPRARQSRRARRQAGDGRQGGAVQALRRHRSDRPRSLDRGPRRDRQLRQAARQELGRHQPRGHQGAGMLHHRAAAARAARHSGVPRRPARHRDHRGGAA